MLRLSALLATLLLGALCTPLGAQEARVRAASRVAMPTQVDSNSPAFWRDGQLNWFGSHGLPWLSQGPDQFGPWVTRDVNREMQHAHPMWMESVWPEENGVLWGWYHAEPGDLFPDSTMTAPKIGAVMSLDGGLTLRDLGFVLESGDPLNPAARNGYFAGGHGDFSVILDRDRSYFYFFFDNYGGDAETQGVCVARMAFADRANPDGKVWKYHQGEWREAGRGGRVSPIFPVQKSWAARDPDALWGPSVHWNTYLNCYVMLLNRAMGEPGWSQEGVYVSFCYDLTRPESWTPPRKILDKSAFSGWYFFYPQVMGLEPGGTDRRAGQVARLYVGGVSRWEIEFVAAPNAPVSALINGGVAELAVGEGGATTLAVDISGAGPFTYQWFKDGVALPGATGATLTLGALSATDAGRYTVVVANPYGSVPSSPLTLSVTPARVVERPVEPPPPPPEAFLANLSVRTMLGSERSALSVGFVLDGAGAKKLALRAVGPALLDLGIGNAAADPRLELYDAAAVKTAENDDWFVADAPTFVAVGAFPLAPGSHDAALVADVPPGAGTALVRATAGGVTLVEIYDPAPSRAGRIVNLSARARVGAGERLMIGGLSLGGAGSKRFVVRVLGPQLAAFGVNEPLDDPALEVHEAGAGLVAQNDDWDSALADTFTAAGAPALTPGSRDAAVAVTLTAGRNYTVIVRSASGELGDALLEIYEVR